jgi:hypothetical protein
MHTLAPVLRGRADGGHAQTEHALQVQSRGFRSRRRRNDLCAVVERRLGVRLAERSMGEILRQLGFARRRRARTTRGESPKPMSHMEQKTSPIWYARRWPRRRRASRLRGWFQNGARVGSQGTLTRLGARKGPRPRAPKEQLDSVR